MEKFGTSGIKCGSNSFKSKVPYQGKNGPPDIGGKQRYQRVSPKATPPYHSTPKDRSHINGFKKNENNLKPSFPVQPLPLIAFKQKEELDDEQQKQEKVRLEDALMKLNINALKSSDEHFNHLIVTSSQSAMYEYDASIGNWNKTSTVGCLFIYLRTCAPVYGIVIMNRMAMENMYLLVNPHTEFELSEPYLLAKLEDGIRCFWFYTSHECLKVARALMKLGMSFKPEDKKKLSWFEETEWETDDSPTNTSPNKPTEPCDLTQVLEKLAMSSKAKDKKGQVGTLHCPTPIKLFGDGNKGVSSGMKKPNDKPNGEGNGRHGKRVFRHCDANKGETKSTEYMQTVEQLERGKDRGSSGSDSSSGALDSNYDPAIIRCTPPGSGVFDTKSFEASLKKTLGINQANQQQAHVALPESFQKFLSGTEVMKPSVLFGDFDEFPLRRRPLKGRKSPEDLKVEEPKKYQPFDFTTLKANIDVKKSEVKPLTKVQLVQAMTHLFTNDDEFVSKIHATYLENFSKSTR